MTNKVSAVYNHGKDGYHIERTRRFEEKDRIDAFTDAFLAKHPDMSYTEATQKAIHVVIYHDEVSEGYGVGKDAHDILKENESLNPIRNQRRNDADR